MPETTLVFLILAATILLFVSGWLRLDVVALLALLALALAGILTPAEAVAGFADPIVLMIAALFVVGGALFMGGTLTLIGTAPNIVVANQLAAEGLESFRFFDFTPIGIVALVAGVLFMLLVGRRLLPARASATGPDAPGGVPAFDAEELVRDYGIGEIVRLRVLPDSTLIGRTATQAELRRRFGVNIVRLQHPGRRTLRPRRAAQVFVAGDTLDVRGEPGDIERFAAEERLEAVPAAPVGDRLDLAEVLLTPRVSSSTDSRG